MEERLRYAEFSISNESNATMRQKKNFFIT